MSTFWHFVTTLFTKEYDECMCGIIAYTGTKVALPLLVDGLTKLEYRGYDSAGVYAPEDGTFRAVGSVKHLSAVAPQKPKGKSGIAHTRWATHGPPSEKNAHPHASQGATLHLVHNGIIENFREIKDSLALRGHVFLSDTDSEVLAHLIGRRYAERGTRHEAIAEALSEVRGTYGIAIIFSDAPTTVYAAAMGSPIALGVGTDEMWVASDASAIIHATQRVVYLEDGEYATVTPTEYAIKSLEHAERPREPTVLTMNAEALSKKGYPHFMLKEIMEIPEVIRNTMRGRLQPGGVAVKLGGLEEVERELTRAEHLDIVGCGSAFYAGLYGKQIIEELSGIPVSVHLGSELRYRPEVKEEKTVLLAVSQSGETADTLAAVKVAKQKGTLTLGLVNAVGSTIARTTDAGVYNHAGPEIGVASTKAYISQLVGLGLIAIKLGVLKGADSLKLTAFARALQEMPHLAQEVLFRESDIQAVAEKYADTRHMLYIGRRYNAANAYEGALKIKEVSYIHAEGYPAGEMKHGPLAMIDPDFPTLAIAPRDSVYEKMVSNIEEIRARSGPIIMVATDGDKSAAHLADDVLWIPPAHEALTPILAAVTLQLFAYHAAMALGHNVDRPRNLAKSVTVE